MTQIMVKSDSNRRGNDGKTLGFPSCRLVECPARDSGEQRGLRDPTGGKEGEIKKGGEID